MEEMRMLTEMFGMIGNYEQRKVERYDKGNLMVSTARNTDSDQPFETAIAHPKYNDGKIVVVEMYDDMESAKAGHLRWVKTMTAKQLPKTLKNVSTSTIAKLIDTL